MLNTEAVLELPKGQAQRKQFIDAEDPRRSTWTRYINHADSATTGCNLSPRADPSGARLGLDRPLVWFVARRDIRVGEELGFSYGPSFSEWLRTQ